MHTAAIDVSMTSIKAGRTTATAISHGFIPRVKGYAPPLTPTEGALTPVSFAIDSGALLFRSISLDCHLESKRLVGKTCRGRPSCTQCAGTGASLRAPRLLL